MRGRLDCPAARRHAPGHRPSASHARRCCRAAWLEARRAHPAARCRSRCCGCRGRRSPGPGTRPSTSTSTPRISPPTRPTRSWSRCSIAPAWAPSANMDGGTGAHLDAALKAGAPYQDRVANFITFSADGINEPGWSREVRRRDGARVQGRRARDEGVEDARPDREEPRRHVHPGRRSAPRSDLGHGREIRPAGDDPPQRLDRPLLPDQPEERALRSRPLGQARRHRGQLLQERVSDPRRRSSGRARTCTASIRRRGSSTRTWRCSTTTRPRSRRCWTPIRTPTSRSRRRCRISGARRGCGASSSSSTRTACCSGPDGSPERGVDDFWTPHWRFLETFDEYFEHPAQLRTEGGSPGHGRWNISGIGLPDDVLRKVYYENALRHLPALEGLDPAAVVRAMTPEWLVNDSGVVGQPLRSGK